MCENYFNYHYIEDNDADDGSEFDYPFCGAALRMNID